MHHDRQPARGRLYPHFKSRNGGCVALFTPFLPCNGQFVVCNQLVDSLCLLSLHRRERLHGHGSVGSIRLAWQRRLGSSRIYSGGSRGHSGGCRDYPGSSRGYPGGSGGHPGGCRGYPDSDRAALRPWSRADDGGRERHFCPISYNKVKKWANCKVNFDNYVYLCYCYHSRAQPECYGMTD